MSASSIRDQPPYAPHKEVAARTRVPFFENGLRRFVEELLVDWGLHNDYAPQRAKSPSYVRELSVVEFVPIVACEAATIAGEFTHHMDHTREL